jgi:hypothetical protein
LQHEEAPAAAAAPAPATETVTPNSQLPHTPRARIPDATAAGAEAAIQGQAGNPLQQLIASLAAAAAAASSQLPASSNALSPCHSGSMAQSSTQVQPAAAACKGSSKYPSRSQSPARQQQQQPWVNPLYGTTRRPSPGRDCRDGNVRSSSTSPTRGRQQLLSAERSAGPRVPPLKTLTPDESAKLMGLYK